MKVLRLTLFKKWFDEIVAGRKKVEYRDMKPYWSSRLLRKRFDYVLFVNGYGPGRPSVLVKKHRICMNFKTKKFEIHLGEILRKELC